MPDVIIFGDTVRSAELRHEVPITVPDPFVYVERNGTRTAFVGSLEIPRLEDIDGLEVVPFEELGLDELVEQGYSWHDIMPQLVLRACRASNVASAVTPRDFPLGLADFLRSHEIEIEARGELFDERRRVKTAAELDGIRRCQRASERAMSAIRERLCAGGPVTCEGLQTDAMRVFARRACSSMTSSSSRQARRRRSGTSPVTAPSASTSRSSSTSSRATPPPGATRT